MFRFGYLQFGQTLSSFVENWKNSCFRALSGKFPISGHARGRGHHHQQKDLIEICRQVPNHMQFGTRLQPKKGKKQRFFSKISLFFYIYITRGLRPLPAASRPCFRWLRQLNIIVYSTCVPNLSMIGWAVLEL